MTAAFNNFFLNELRLLGRTKVTLLSMIFFALLVILLLQISLPLFDIIPTQWFIPMLWLSLLFGGIIRMNRTFAPENESELMDILRLEPQMATPLFVSKFLINFLILIGLAAVSVLFIVILFNLNFAWVASSSWWFPIMLGCFGFATMGTICSGMVFYHDQRDLLLPIMLYPLLIPIILGVILSVNFSGSGMELNWDWIKILVCFDVIFATAALMLFHHLFNA